MEVARLKASSSIDKYLGLPSIVDRSRINVFEEIVDRVEKKLGNCKHRFLSTTRKESLIKSILQATPIYNMSAFLLRLFAINCIHSLLSFCGVQRIITQKLIGRFGNSGKSKGGLGFRDLLAKQT